MWVPCWLPEEQRCLYEQAVANLQQALNLTRGTAAVRQRAAWWEKVGQDVSALGHHLWDGRVPSKHLRDTLGGCKRNLRAATAA